MKVLDRYLIRETIPPFLLALAVYTFVLAVDPMLSQAQLLLSKGVPIPTVAFMLATLLPQALGVTIPMAFLTGLFVFHEPLRPVQLASFVAIWAAIAIYSWDVWSRRKAMP